MTADMLKGTRFAKVMQSLVLETIFSVILAAGDLKKNTRGDSVLFLNSHLIIKMRNHNNISFSFRYKAAITDKSSMII